MKLPITNKYVPEPNIYAPRTKSFYFYAYDDYGGEYHGICRETLEACLAESNYFFVFNGKYLNNGIKAIRKVEKSLRVKGTSKFYRTKTKRVIRIELGMFWSANSLRRSVFTALLKSKYRYFKSKKAKELLSLFVKGHTRQSPRYYSGDGFLANLECEELSNLVRK